MMYLLLAVTFMATKDEGLYGSYRIFSSYIHESAFDYNIDYDGSLTNCDNLEVRMELSKRQMDLSQNILCNQR